MSTPKCFIYRISLNLYNKVSLIHSPILPIKMLRVREVKWRGGGHAASKQGFQLWDLSGVQSQGSDPSHILRLTHTFSFLHETFILSCIWSGLKCTNSQLSKDKGITLHLIKGKTETIIVLYDWGSYSLMIWGIELISLFPISFFIFQSLTVYFVPWIRCSTATGKPISFKTLLQYQETGYLNSR